MTSLYLQNQAAMLIAYFMDNYECNNVCDNVLDLSESWLSGPVANSMISEIRLIGRTLFYLPLIMGNGRSIGQDFANLSLSFRSENLHLENQKRNIKFQPLDQKILCLVSLAYIFLPYLNERKELIFDQVHEQIKILSEDECLANSPNSNNLPNLSNTSLHATNVTAASDSTTSPQSLVGKVADRESMFVVLFRAIANSWYSVAGSNAQRMTTAVKLLQDVHNYYFLLHGRYFELALRLCQVELVSHFKPASNIKLQKLSYLLGLRVALLAYYGARVIAKEVDAQIAASEAVHREPDGATAGAGSGDDSSMSTHKNNGANSSGGSGTSCSSSVTGGTMIRSSNNKCVLCLDALTHPTAVPCGHVFCWDCILPHTMSTAGESNRDGNDEHSDGHSVSDGQTSRCPVCRADFPISKVRALYSY